MTLIWRMSADFLWVGYCEADYIKKRNLPGGRQAQVERIERMWDGFFWLEVYADLIDIGYLSKSYL